MVCIAKSFTVNVASMAILVNLWQMSPYRQVSRRQSDSERSHSWQIDFAAGVAIVLDIEVVDFWAAEQIFSQGWLGP
jgi:hypothetical protein